MVEMGGETLRNESICHVMTHKISLFFVEKRVFFKKTRDTRIVVAWS